MAHENGKIKWNELVETHDIKPENLLATDQAVEPSAKSHGRGAVTKHNLRQSLLENSSGHKKNKHVRGERARKRENMHLAHRPSDEMDLMIEAVNAADLGWKADTCKYQRTHAKYGDHCDNGRVNLA